jgi:hypothetical protein
VPALEVLLFVPLVVANPRRITRESRHLRGLAIGLVLLIAIANAVTLVLLVRQLVTGRASEGTTLLLAAGQVWVTNILLFSLVYWELDRGGSVQRTHTPRPRLPAADFRFPQDEDHDTIAEVRQRDDQAGDPTTMRTTPTVDKLIPLTDVVTANFRIAPIAINTKLEPILMNRSPSWGSWTFQGYPGRKP